MNTLKQQSIYNTERMVSEMIMDISLENNNKDVELAILNGLQDIINRLKINRNK